MVWRVHAIYREEVGLRRYARRDKMVQLSSKFTIRKAEIVALLHMNWPSILIRWVVRMCREKDCVNGDKDRKMGGRFLF